MFEVRDIPTSARAADSSSNADQEQPAERAAAGNGELTVQRHTTLMELLKYESDLARAHRMMGHLPRRGERGEGRRGRTDN